MFNKIPLLFIKSMKINQKHCRKIKKHNTKIKAGMQQKNLAILQFYFGHKKHWRKLSKSYNIFGQEFVHSVICCIPEHFYQINVLILV